MRNIEQTIATILMSNKPVVLVDIDGVMLDNQHRLPHICEIVDGREQKKRKADWATYTSLAHLDTPGAFCRVVRAIRTSILPVYLTARADSYADDRREALEARLSELTGDHTPLLVKRKPTAPGESFTSAVEYKRGVVRQLREAGVIILFAVDDSHKNCLMFEEEGVPALRLYSHLTPERMTY